MSITVLLVPVGKLPQPKLIPSHKEPGHLEALQELVGGYIELVSGPCGLDFWIDDEGRLKADALEDPLAEFNTTVPRVSRWGMSHTPIFGPIVVARHDAHGNTTGLSQSDIAGLISSPLFFGGQGRT